MLNRELYRQLCNVFGKNSVTVHRSGEAGVFKKEQVLRGNHTDYKLTRVPGVSPGEEYSVKCPFCSDHSPRLYINYRWGTKDPFSGKRILWLMHCYNEECQAVYANRLALAQLVFDNDDTIQVLDVADETEPEAPRQVTLPGAMQSLEVLAETNMRHPAVLWCMSRQLDIVELSRRYGVGYCVVPKYAGSPNAERLVVPFYARGKSGITLAGWTARILRKVAQGEAKWRHSWAATGQIVYGIGEAAAYQTIVVTEGPGDKFAVGRPAVAMLGKAANAYKMQRIADVVQDDPRRLIVILLDPDQDKMAKARRREHHSTVAANLMRSLTKTPVIDVRLPSGSDPGSLDRKYIWRYIIREAARQGFTAGYTAAAA